MNANLKAQVIEEFNCMQDGETHPISIMKMCIREVFASNGIIPKTATFDWKSAQSDSSAAYMKSRFGR